MSEQEQHEIRAGTFNRDLAIRDKRHHASGLRAEFTRRGGETGPGKGEFPRGACRLSAEREEPLIPHHQPVLDERHLADFLPARTTGNRSEPRRLAALVVWTLPVRGSRDAFSDLP